MQLQHQLCGLAIAARVFAIRGIDGSSRLALSTTDHSNGQGHGGFPKEYGDHEDNESTHQAAAAQRDDAGDEHGDDEGK